MKHNEAHTELITSLNDIHRLIYLKNMSGTPQRRKNGKLVVCVQVCGCKVCEVLLKSRDPHLASGEKEKPTEGRKEGKGREGKGSKQRL